MSLATRGILFPLVALVLGVAPLGCAASSTPDEDDVAVAAADCNCNHEEMANAVGMSAEQKAKLAELHAAHHHAHDVSMSAEHRPSIEQIVKWFTVNLDLTPEQAAKLRHYLETHMPGGAQSGTPAHP